MHLNQRNFPETKRNFMKTTWIGTRILHRTKFSTDFTLYFYYSAFAFVRANVWSQSSIFFISSYFCIRFYCVLFRCEGSSFEARIYNYFCEFYRVGIISYHKASFCSTFYDLNKRKRMLMNVTLIWRQRKTSSTRIECWEFN